ncbi:MAG: U32 family peptidase [Spirochaetales bacterium]|nr:U32 family peptidase [Spirochaetales bacterium]
MELVAPAGNLEKLICAYQYGADAVYIGIRDFSLRAKADNFSGSEYEAIGLMKGPGKKLFCALNIYFHEKDIGRLEASLDYIGQYPFDAFIVSDIGVLPVLKKHFPRTPLHLSTQANCINSESARLYCDMGFSRIILGRELSLREIGEIRKRCGCELEVFVHGAMCLAYAGRCFLSAYMAGRSANSGDCAHSCRWSYMLLEEAERPGEYFPVCEADGHTTILSSKDICMIDHLKSIKEAGIDAIKIEGRMKSLYYTAVTTRAYRKALDELSGNGTSDLHRYREELFKVSRREFSTGFYFGRNEIETPARTSYIRPYSYLGCIGKEVTPGFFELKAKNSILKGDTLEYIGPDILYIEDDSFILYDEEKNEVAKADHGKPFFIRTGKAVKEGYIVRKKSEDENSPQDKRVTAPHTK